MMLAANMFVGPEIDWFKISPLLVMLGGVLLLILAGSLTPQWKKGAYGIVGALTAAGAAVSTALLWRDLGNGAQSSLLANAVTFSKFTLFATFSIAIATLLAILVTSGFLVREDEDSPEIFALILSAAIGGMVMVQANDLIVMFLGLETLSLAFYLLTASSRSRSASGEAGLKYFVLGGFASAFFLYGVALVFGATGSTNIDAIAASLAKDTVLGGSSAMLLAGIALLLVGFALDSQVMFVIAVFVFGVASFANVPAMQLRVMNHGGEGQELAATANISAFNLANAFGGFLGGMVLDSQMGAGMIPYAAVIIPVLGLAFISIVNKRETRAANTVAVPCV